jgi:serine/threonine protein kinase
MLRLGCNALIVLAWLMIMPMGLAFAASKGKLYSDGKLIGEVLEVKRQLGKGGYSDVFEITFRDSQGNILEKALKEFKPSIHSSTIEEIQEAWSYLEPTRAEDKEKVLSHGTAGLKLISEDPHNTQSVTQVILLDLANGSALSAAPSLKVNPRHPYFGAKLEVALKYKRDILSAITLLSSHGLAHGDIKPENVLYTKKAGFDFEKPDASKIHFSLSDFDTLAPVGQIQRVHTEGYAPPELVVDEIERASASRDLYSHAVAVHTLMFGDHPFEKHFKALKGSAATPAQFESELFDIFDNPRLYNEYIKSINERFEGLQRLVKSKPDKEHLRELHDFVINGLKLNPHERLAAFPEIKNRLQRHAEAQRNCSRSILNSLNRLYH